MESNRLSTRTPGPVRPALPLLIALTAALPGCEVVKGIFKAGVWTGVIVVVFFLALIGGIAAMFRRA